MVNDPHNSPWIASRQKKPSFPWFRSRETSEHRVGLRPADGWQKRNIKYLADVLIPSLLRPRKPGHVGMSVPEAADHEVGVTWLGHAAFLIQMEGLNVLVDPNWALWLGPVKRQRHPSIYAHDLPRVDLVLITHAHFDHLHIPSLKRVANGQTIIVPKGVGTLVKRLDFGKVVELDTWQDFGYRDLRVTLTPAKHWGARMIHDVHRHFGGFLVQSDAKTVYHCGDSAMFDGFEEIGKRAEINTALMPIGAYDNPSARPVHMTPEEALDAFAMLNAQWMVPMHHDTFALSGEPLHEPAQRLESEALLRGLTERVHILLEGQSILV